MKTQKKETKKTFVIEIDSRNAVVFGADPLPSREVPTYPWWPGLVLDKKLYPREAEGEGGGGGGGGDRLLVCFKAGGRVIISSSSVHHPLIIR